MEAELKANFVHFPGCKLVGMHADMSLSDDRTMELWKGFMPRRGEIKNVVGDDLYSVRIYPGGYFDQIDLGKYFEKWAAAMVTEATHVPEGMQLLVIPAGYYAVFRHRGGPIRGDQTYRFIYGEWLKAGAHSLDERPHFEILGKKYKGNDPDSEEDIYVPLLN